MGRITENGLVPPKKKMASGEAATGIVDKQYGASAYLESLGVDIRDRLKKTLSGGMAIHLGFGSATDGGSTAIQAYGASL